MSGLGDLLRARALTSAPASVGVEELPYEENDAHPRASAFAPAAVSDSSELRRILALPRRPWLMAPDDPVVMAMTLRFRRPGGTMVLRPLQARALAEAMAAGGLMAALGVGEGKTLLAFLLSTALESKVTVLMVPAALVGQVHALHAEYAKHWLLPSLGNTFSPGSKGVVHVVSYSQLSSVRGADRLEVLKPDLVVGDEIHSVRRTSAARTKRFFRYVKKYPGTKLCGLSGSIITDSVRDPYKLAGQALGDRSPYPRTYEIIAEWAGALDPSDYPADPGDLVRLVSPGSIESVREAFGRRVNETPGFVVSDQNALASSLTVHERPIVTPPEITAALDKMRTEFCTPGGEEFKEALDLWRYGQQLAAGLYYKWIWPRGESLELRKEWMEARKEWHREIRTFLAKSSKPGLDSPLLLMRAAAKGEWASASYERWAAVRGQAKPATEAVWVSEFLAADAVDWGTKHVGVIWYEVSELGRRIAKLGKFPYYGPGKEAAKGLLAEDGTRTVVASRRAHGEGKNLQAFHDQLLTTPMSSGKAWEQTLGRMHRQGQRADDVDAWVYRHTPECKKAIEDARKDAAFIQAALGARQKLTYCNWTF